MIQLTPFIKSFSVNFTPSAEYDVNYYKIYAEPFANMDGGDFIPSESNLINEGPETSFFHNVDTGGIWGVKIAAVDTFGDDILNYSDLVTVHVPTLDPLDQVAPPVPTWNDSPPFSETGVEYADVTVKTYIAVAWELADVPEDLAGFVLAYRRVGAELWTEVVTTSAYCRVESVTSGRAYDFKVKSYDTWNNTSAWSTIKTVTAQKDLVPPAKPATLSASGGIGCIKLKWSPYVDKDAKHTNIYRGVTTDKSSAEVIGTAVGITYTDSSALTGTVYTYWVSTVDYSDNESECSSYAQATPTTIMAADLDISTRVDFVVRDSIFLFDHVDSPGVASTTLRWSAGSISRGAQEFALVAGSLSAANNKYIIATLADSTATLKTQTLDSSLASEDDVIIAVTSSSALVETNNYACFVRQSNSMALEGALIRDASISSAKIGSLSANKITAGTLDCDLVTLQNLTFSDVGGAITWGSITGAPTSVAQLNLNDGAKLTYIDSAGLYSGTISANKIVAGAFTNSVGVGYAGTLQLDGERSRITVFNNNTYTDMVTIGNLGVDALLNPNYGIVVANTLGQPVLRVDNNGAVIQNITAGTIDADKVTINNLMVGKNVVMGPDAKISWGGITDVPQFKTSELLDDAGFLTPTWTNISGRPNTTYIASNGIYTGALLADQIMATNFVAQSANIADASIKTAHIDDLSSSSYVAGSVGWKIAKNGNAEFNNVTVRGNLHATTFTADNAVIQAAHIVEASIGTLHVKAGAITYTKGATFYPNFYNGVQAYTIYPTTPVAHLDVCVTTPGYYIIFVTINKSGNLAYGTEAYLLGVQSIHNPDDGDYPYTNILSASARLGGSLDGARSWQYTVYLSVGNPPFPLPDGYVQGANTHRILLCADTFWDPNSSGIRYISDVSISIFGGKR